jgi:hypothetical protein
MSRIDPGLLQPNIPRMDPWPTLVQRQQEDLQRANIESQIAERKANEMLRGIAAQEKLAQAQKMQQDWEEKRRTYDAQEAVRARLKEANDRGLPMPSVNELIGIGGNYAMPFIKEILDREKIAHENDTAKFEQYSRLQTEMGKEAIGLKNLRPDQRPEAHRQAVQRMRQAGIIPTDEMANQILASHDTEDELDQIIATTPARELQIKEQQAELESRAKKNKEDEEAFRAHQEGLYKQEELGRIQKNLPPTPVGPPQPSAGYTPEAFEQQKELAKLRAQIAAENKVDPSQILTGQDENGEAKFFVYDKKTGTTKVIEGLTPKAKEPPATIQTNVNVAGRALEQTGIIRNILKAHPEMVGPVMGRLSEFMQGIGTNPFAGNKQLEELGATLSGHLRYLFAQELKNAIGARPGEMLAKELKEASPSRKQDIALLNGFLASVENNAKVTLRAAKKQYKYDPFKVEDEGGGGTAPTGGWKVINVK